MAKKSFAKVLRETRLRIGLSQTELGQRVGLTGSYISQLESGQRRPLIGRRVEALCQALGVPTELLQDSAELERSTPTVRRKIEAMQRERGKVTRARHRFIGQMLYHLARDPSELDVEAMSKAEQALLHRLLKRARQMDSLKQVERELGLLFEGIPNQDCDKLMHTLPVLFQQVEAPSERPLQSIEHSRVQMLPVRASLSSNDNAGEMSHELVAWGIQSTSEGRDHATVSADAFWLRVPNDDTYPRYSKGDLLLLDPVRPARDGDWCVLEHERALYVRMIRKQRDGYAAESVRADTPPIRIDSWDPSRALCILALLRQNP